VHIASNGEEALDIYKKENISAIFTDFEMPVMDGYSLVKTIRETNKEIPRLRT
jgi:CheY-like chemotaxis protein